MGQGRCRSLRGRPGRESRGKGAAGVVQVDMVTERAELEGDCGLNDQVKNQGGPAGGSVQMRIEHAAQHARSGVSSLTYPVATCLTTSAAVQI